MRTITCRIQARTGTSRETRLSKENVANAARDNLCLTFVGKPSCTSFDKRGPRLWEAKLQQASTGGVSIPRSLSWLCGLMLSDHMLFELLKTSHPATLPWVGSAQKSKIVLLCTQARHSAVNALQHATPCCSAC